MSAYKTSTADNHQGTGSAWKNAVLRAVCGARRVDAITLATEIVIPHQHIQGTHLHMTVRGAAFAGAAVVATSVVAMRAAARALVIFFFTGDSLGYENSTGSGGS